MCITETNGLFKEEYQEFCDFFGIAVAQVCNVIGLAQENYQIIKKLEFISHVLH